MKFFNLYTFFCLILLISIIIILYKLYRKNDVHPLQNSPHFVNYIKNIHPNLYPIKISDFSSNNNEKFYQTYLSKLNKPSLHQLEILHNYTDYIDNLLLKQGIHGLDKVNWLFLISDNELEKSMPFTLGEYIIISKKDIILMERKKTKHFIEILIHEKLHVLQRKYQLQFNSFYKRTYKFLHKRLKLSEVPLHIKTNYMTNPDSNFDFWTYKWNKTIYYPYLKYNFKNDSISDCLLSKSSTMGNINKFKDFIKVKYHNISIYHPNEIFAYTVSKHILDNSLDEVFVKFLNAL